MTADQTKDVQEPRLEDVFRTIAREEISKSKRGGFLYACLGVGAILALSLTCLLGGSRGESASPATVPVTSLAAMTLDTPAPLTNTDLSKARIVALVSALMISADDRLTGDELEFAYSLFSKRQVDNFGAAILPASDNVKAQYIDRALIRKQFDEASEYLTMALSDLELIRRQETSLTDLNEIISEYKPAGDDVAVRSARLDLLNQTLDLTSTWVNRIASSEDIGKYDAQERSRYRAMQMKIMQRLDRW